MASNTYLTQRVRDALVQSHGDPLRAKRILLQWAGRDDRLLRTLVGPHIRAIVAAAVDRHAGQQAQPGGAPARRGNAPKNAPKDVSLDSVVDRMGERFGGAVEPPRGMTALLHGSGSKMPNAGKRHADSLRTLAVAFARKRFDP